MSKKFIINVICTIVAGITRILYCWVYPVSVRDSFAYKEVIEYWIRFGYLPEESHSPPLGLYIFKVAAEAYHYDIIKTGILINVILGIGIVLSIIWISFAIGLSNLKTFLIGIIAATHPTLVQYSCQMIREDSYLLFCFLAILSTIVFLKGNRIRHLILISVFAAAAYLCRHEALELVPIISLILFFFSKDACLGRIKKIVLFLVLYAGFFLGIACMLDVPIDYYKSYFDYSVSTYGSN